MENFKNKFSLKGRIFLWIIAEIKTHWYFFANSCMYCVWERMRTRHLWGKSWSLEDSEVGRWLWEKTLPVQKTSRPILHALWERRACEWYIQAAHSTQDGSSMAALTSCPTVMYLKVATKIQTILIFSSPRWFIFSILLYPRIPYIKLFKVLSMPQ